MMEPTQLKEIEDLIQNYHPYSPKGQERCWHDQIKSVINVLGAEIGFASIPEYRVISPRIRKGTGRIDMVWVDSRNHPIIAFEIDVGLKGGSIGKLKLIDAPYKYAITVEKPKIREHHTDSLIKDTGIKNIKVRSTADFAEYLRSSEQILLSIVSFKKLISDNHAELNLSNYNKIVSNTQSKEKLKILINETLGPCSLVELIPPELVFHIAFKSETDSRYAYHEKFAIFGISKRINEGLEVNQKQLKLLERLLRKAVAIDLVGKKCGKPNCELCERLMDLNEETRKRSKVKI